MKQSNSNLITSCTITWNHGGSAPAEGIAKVITRILQTEVQVRFYNSQDDLLRGSIWPMSDLQRQELFHLLEICHHEWTSDDYSAGADDGPHWQLKICTRKSCLRCIEGTAEPPPLGEVIKDMLVNIVGEQHCYFY